MAGLNQNPLLTLDALGPCGVVLPTEVSAALDVSLNLKARELGVQGFLFWGKLSTVSGRDYYVARAYNGTKRVDGKVIVQPGNKYYYSQDGVNWLDLEPVAAGSKAENLDCESPPLLPSRAAKHDSAARLAGGAGGALTTAIHANSLSKHFGAFLSPTFGLIRWAIP
jgi:hypothetical protein